MARFHRHPKSNVIVRIDMSGEEFARFLDISTEQLSLWSKSFPEPSGPDQWTLYADRDDLDLYKKRAAVLKTNMSEEAVFNVESQGLLDAYAKLAEDCPDGITAHVWRSYGTIVFMQTRFGETIFAKELAQRAQLEREENGRVVLDEDLAEKHIRFLIAQGLLREGTGDWAGKWDHEGLPLYFQEH